MRTAKFWTTITLAASAVWAIAPASAQEAPQPPRLQKLEEGEKPETNIPGGGVPQTEITQTVEQGKVNSVKVNRGNNTYYLKPNAPAGSAVQGDAQASGNRGAQWQVMQFNFNREEEKRKEAAKSSLRKQPIEPPPPVR